ncbi:MAG: hypothetical protein VW521_12640 [Rhodospirillales bacterium]|jgi:butyrate kinase
MNSVDEALARLDKHEAECALRYEMIQRQLDEHNNRFDRLESLMTRGFFAIGVMITTMIAILEFIR